MWVSENELCHLLTLGYIPVMGVPGDWGHPSALEDQKEPETELCFL